MLEFSDGHERAGGAAPAPVEADVLGAALRRAASTISRLEPAWGDTPFALGGLLGGAPGRVAGGVADRAPVDQPACVDEFLGAVCSYVRALRAKGTPPEQVVISVKRHMQVALGPYADPRRINAWLAHAVTWGIEEYYRDD